MRRYSFLWAKALPWISYQHMLRAGMVEQQHSAAQDSARRLIITKNMNCDEICYAINGFVHTEKENRHEQ